MKILKQIAKAILNEEISNYEKVIKDMGTTIYNLTYESPKEEYYNTKYPQTIQTYYKHFLGKKLDLPVQVFCGNYTNPNLIKLKGTDDKKAIAGLAWCMQNLKYVPDKTDSGMTEYWKLSYETLATKKGDCEDGAILLYDILRANGISAWKLRLTCGWAVNPWDGKVEGHCYLTYYSEEYDKWIALDWCYFPNAEQMDKQPSYKDVSFYGDVWFSFNENYCWGNYKWQK